MPDFLESKLRSEYGDNNSAIYGTMNSIGAMRGNKITAKGRAMERKHASDQIPKRMAQGGTVIPNWQSLDEPEISPLERAALLAKQQQEQQQAQQPGLAPQPQPQPQLPQPPPPQSPPEQALDQSPNDDGSIDDAPGASAAVDPEAIPPAKPPASSIAPPVDNREEIASTGADLGQPMPPGWKSSQSSQPEAIPSARPSALAGPIGEDEFLARASRALARKSFKTGKDGQLTDEPKGIPAWKLALGAAIPRLAPVLNATNEMERNLPMAEKIAAIREKAQAAATNASMRAEDIATKGDERKTLADTRLTNASIRQDYAEIARQRIADQKSGRNQKFIETWGRGRMDDLVYLKDTEPKPPGYEFLPDPEHPGYSFGAPPALRVVPKELVPWIPGSKEGDLIPHSELKKAMAMAQMAKLEETKAANRPDVLDAATRTAVASFGGDPKKAEDVARGRKLVQSDAIAKSNAEQKPPQALMLLPDGRGGQTGVVVKPGTNLPAGAMTPAGVNSVNVPTSSTRTMAEIAPRVIQLADRVEQLLNENEAQLGPLRSRWAEYKAGKIGLPNKGYTQVRTDTGLLTTALMRMHVGARGGTDIMKHFQDLIDSSKQDPDNLRAALGEIKAYAKTVAAERVGGPDTGGGGNVGGGVSAPKVIKWGRDPQGNPVPIP